MGGERVRSNMGAGGGGGGVQGMEPVWGGGGRAERLNGGLSNGNIHMKD